MYLKMWIDSAISLKFVVETLEKILGLFCIF